ncbi:tetratricopeptide repeat protein [Amycolatopsis sp. NPDC088138]|uniref:tetratricopeptide repeat protein n=1 Tax=Amycolatopsis sp. NPDC088138 TaxID=3363938 RepID=UPI0038231784
MATAVRGQWWRGHRFWSVFATVLASAALGVATNVATSTPGWGWIAGGAVLVLALLGLALADLARTTRARTADLFAARGELMDPSWPDPGRSAEGAGWAGGTGDPGGVLFWLDARFCPGPLWGRSGPRRELARWCAAESGTDVVRIVSGPGGIGKSRLVLELARHHLPEGWFAGRPDTGRLDEVVGRVLACAQPALLVIEDADRIAGLAGFLQRAAAEPDRIRVVLTSRDGDALRTRLRDDPDTALGPVLRAPVLELPAVGDAEDRQRWYVEAVRHYAHALDLPRPDVPGTAPVGHDGDAMLVLQARALLTVLDRPGARTLGLDDVVVELAGTERQRWARDPRLPSGWDTRPEVPAQVVGVLALLPASDPGQAAEWLRALAPLAGEGARPDRAALAGWACTRYPVGPDGRIEVRPHLVGEWLLLQTAETVFAHFSGLDPETVVSATAVVARACGSFPRWLPVLWQLLRRYPELAGRTVPVVLDHGVVSPALDRGLEAVMLDAPHDQIDALLAPRLSWDSFPHALCAQWTLRVRRRREPPAGEPGRNHEVLAEALTNLGMSLRGLGRVPEALPVVTEAVGLYRELDAADPGRYRPELAQALATLGSGLTDLGRAPEAVPVHTEAVELRRQLVAVDPDRYRPDLARCLGNLGNALGEAGRGQGEGLAVLAEAMGVWRELAAADPGRHRADLATCLNNLGGSLHRAGRAPEAVPLQLESIGLYRELDAADPGRYRSDLALSLNNLGNSLRTLGRAVEAVPVFEEAVKIRQELAAADPGRHRPDLATSLNNLGAGLEESARAPESVVLQAKATGIWRELVAADPRRYRVECARSLTNLGICLRSAGRASESVTAQAEAAGLWRELVAVDPGRYRPDLARSLNDLGVSLHDLGRNSESVATHEETTAIRRELTAAEPDRYRADLAGSLTNLGVSLARSGRSAEALASWQEAVVLWRLCARQDPQRFGARYRELSAWLQRQSMEKAFPLPLRLDEPG